MEQKERPVQIKIISKQLDSGGDIHDNIINLLRESNDEGDPRVYFNEDFPSGDKIELVTEGIIRDRAGRIELEYDETELTGMEGSTTIVSYDKHTPGIISVLRDGSISTALVFEAGARHICAYETPYMPLELCVTTTTLENNLSYEGGRLELDYVIESGGERTERTRLSLSVISAR